MDLLNSAITPEFIEQINEELKKNGTLKNAVSINHPEFSGDELTKKTDTLATKIRRAGYKKGRKADDFYILIDNLKEVKEFKITPKKTTKPKKKQEETTPTKDNKAVFSSVFLSDILTNSFHANRRIEFKSTTLSLVLYDEIADLLDELNQYISYLPTYLVIDYAINRLMDDLVFMDDITKTDVFSDFLRIKNTNQFTRKSYKISQYASSGLTNISDNKIKSFTKSDVACMALLAYLKGAIDFQKQLDSRYPKN